MPEHEQKEQEFSFKSYFVPFTTLKAIHWIVVIGLVVFANMLFNGFVWDDKSYILFNPDIYSLNFFKAVGPSLFNTAGQYRPVSALYFSFMYFWFHNISFFYHSTELLIHITNTIFLFLIFYKFFNRKLSLFLAIIFLVHPIQVESVSYIGASDNPLFFLFGIIAFFLSLPEKISTKRVMIISFLLLLSILTKETGFLFLFTVLLYRVIFYKSKFLSLFLGEFVITILYFFIRFIVGKVYFAKLELVPIGRLNLYERLINVPSIIFFYLKTFFYPAQLVIDQQWIVEKINFQNFYFPLIFDLFFFLIIIVFGIYLFRINKKKFKLFLFFALVFIAGLGLHSQIFPLDLTVADRWFYFPIIGVLGMIGIVGYSIKLHHKFLRYVGYVVTILIIILSMRSIIRNTNWSDAITLYSHDTQIEDNWDLENNLGTEYKYINNQQQALIHFEKAAAFFPFEATQLSIANTYWNMSDLQKANGYFLKAMHERHLPQNGHKHNLNTYQNYGELLLVSNQPKIARKFFEQALTDYPNSSELWDELAVSQSWIHDQKDAISSAKKALMLQSNQRTNYVYEQIINNQIIKILPMTDGVRIMMYFIKSQSIA